MDLVAEKSSSKPGGLTATVGVALTFANLACFHIFCIHFGRCTRFISCMAVFGALFFFLFLSMKNNILVRGMAHSS
ncbi:hypothetical protein BDF20DRAFT_895287 [Mycotypha africana]|uniref:uncharacterized protein n=1 Tax=Mycotypha africana TaxID=64632 RepID=UPI0022FFF1CC|nr:uncharacterized protein BDF20DRAFT_895287 [Mycotypha africana]KAI8968260.1 hypothetical protein BDF20DRAFT_895287 [Mycotypha africana]